MNKEERKKYLEEHQDEVWRLAKNRVSDATDVELKAFELMNKGNRLLFNEPEFTPEQWYYDRIMEHTDGENHNHSFIVGSVDTSPYLSKIRYDCLREHEMYLYIKENRVIYEKIFDGNSLRVDNDEAYKLERLNEAKELDASLYVVHNHPLEFVVIPSSNDKVVANFLKKNADEIGVELLDVAIVTLDDYYSFKQDKQIK